MEKFPNKRALETECSNRNRNKRFKRWNQKYGSTDHIDNDHASTSYSITLPPPPPPTSSLPLQPPSSPPPHPPSSSPPHTPSYSPPHTPSSSPSHPPSSSPPHPPSPPVDNASEFPGHEDINFALKKWKIRNRTVSVAAFNDLLQTLRNDVGLSNVRKTAKGLMKIKQEFKPKPLKNEAYEEIQFPIINLFKGLIQEMKTKGIHIPEEIILQGNSDGVCPENSSSKGYWTLLLSPINLTEDIVVPVTLTFGRGHPPNLEWLNRGLKQVETLLNKEIDGVRFKIEDLIFDLPALGYTKCINNFQSIDYPCGICEVCARYSPDANTQVINPPTLANSHWTHEDFKHKQCLNQKEVSPITKQLKNKMHLIYGTPPDPLHSVYSGMFKKFIDGVWTGLKTCPGGKLTTARKTAVNKEMKRVLKHLPFAFFSRRPRLFIDLTHYKAAEFRVLLLYCGIVAFKGTLPDNIYSIYQKLFIAITILETPKYVNDDRYLDIAEKLILQFVTDGGDLLGDSFMTIKSHIICHLAYLAKLHRGTLSLHSAFRFESWNNLLKKLVRGRKFHVIEFANRYLEEVSVSFLPDEKTKKKKIKALQNQNFFAVGQHLVIIDSKTGNDANIRVFPKGNPIFTEPINSLRLQIFSVKKHSMTEIRRVPIKDLKIRAVVIPQGENFVVLPLRHLIT